jgi:hypothetical protein
MKAILLGLALSLTLAAAATVSAADKAKENSEAKTKPAKKEKANSPQGLHQEKVALTGSYIPRDVRRNGMITDGPSQVQVIDERAIRASGATDVRQLLTRMGVH